MSEDSHNIMGLYVRGGFLDKRDEDEKEDAFDIIVRESERFSGFLIRDLEGIERGSPDMELLQDCAENFKVIADTGVKNMEDSMDTAMTGVAGVVCNPHEMEDPVEKIAELLENVYLELTDVPPENWRDYPLTRLAGVLAYYNADSWPGGLIEEMASVFKEVYLLPSPSFPVGSLPENVYRIHVLKHGETLGA